MSISIRDMMTDPQLFGDHFAGESWNAWRALLAGFYGLPLSDAELTTWAALTSQQAAPTAEHEELWLVVGRRGGKTQCAALLAVFEAVFNDYTDRLSPGEVATVAVCAADKKQARSAFRYIRGLLHANPMLKALIEREDAESITLNNRVAIEVTASSFRSTRGYTFGCVIADEIAFWRNEDSANPDHEIIEALRPGLATLGGKLICLSSPYAKRGALWEVYRRYFGQSGEILVAQAPTLTMNPTLPEKVVTRALDRDPASAASEYLAQFRNDIDGYVTVEALDAVTRSGPLIAPYDSRHRYSAFIDATGGGADEYTLAIGHREDGLLHIDLVAGRRGVPAEITAEYAELMKAYGITRCHGDKYAGSWVRDEFSKHHVTLMPSEQPKSGLYVDTLAVINSGQVVLPPCDRMRSQFQQLERRTARGGRESIDHPPGGHDDRANAVAGVIAHAGKTRIYDYSALL